MKKIETLAEYQQLASRTCPDLGTPDLNYFHMQSGIITEMGEAIDPIKKHIAYGKPLDIVNVGEEIADAIWYIANRARLFLTEEQNSYVWGTNKEFDKLSADFDKQKDLFPTNLVEVAGLFHGVIPETNITEVPTHSTIGSVGLPDVVILFKAAQYLELDFWQILTNNIAKLQVRYPDKFTNEAALNRDLNAERVELEK